MDEASLKGDRGPARSPDVISRCGWAHDLSQSERRFLTAMNEINFGRFELLRIERGELIVTSSSKIVRTLKFASERLTVPKAFGEAFELRAPIIDFFDYIRRVEDGTILRLEIRWGLPFSMEVTYKPDMIQGRSSSAGNPG